MRPFDLHKKRLNERKSKNIEVISDEPIEKNELTKSTQQIEKLDEHIKRVQILVGEVEQSAPRLLRLLISISSSERIEHFSLTRKRARRALDVSYEVAVDQIGHLLLVLSTPDFGLLFVDIVDLVAAAGEHIKEMLVRDVCDLGVYEVERRFEVHLSTQRH